MIRCKNSVSNCYFFLVRIAYNVLVRKKCSYKFHAHTTFPSNIFLIIKLVKFILKWWFISICKFYKISSECGMPTCPQLCLGLSDFCYGRIDLSCDVSSLFWTVKKKTDFFCSYMHKTCGKIVFIWFKKNFLLTKLY